MNHKLLTLTFSFLSLMGFELGLTAAMQANPSPKSDQKATSDEGATIKGSVEFDPNYLKSWNGKDLVIPFAEIKTKLFQQVKLDPIPFPENWAKLKPEEQQAWAKQFEESEAGKAFIAEREKKIAAAQDFDVIIEKDGKFVVYDIPVGIYGLRGRVDKDLDGTLHGFEVFGQIEIIKGMNEVRLPPIQVAITPMLKAGEIAPPFHVETHDGKSKISLENFKENYVLLSFWITNSPSADYQTKIQEAFTQIKDQHPIRLVSVCVDEKPTDAAKFILEKQLRLGSHAFTSGFAHRTLFDYGVRAIPSFWLISPDGKIAMSQYEFAMAFRTQPDLAQIIVNRIEGKDVPTPAPTPAAPEAPKKD